MTKTPSNDGFHNKTNYHNFLYNYCQIIGEPKRKCTVNWSDTQICPNLVPIWPNTGNPDADLNYMSAA